MCVCVISKGMDIHTVDVPTPNRLFPSKEFTLLRFCQRQRHWVTVLTVPLAHRWSGEVLTLQDQATTNLLELLKRGEVANPWEKMLLHVAPVSPVCSCHIWTCPLDETSPNGPFCVRPLQVNNEVDNPSIHPAKGAEQIRQQDPRTQPLRQAHIEHYVEANPGVITSGHPTPLYNTGGNMFFPTFIWHSPYMFPGEMTPPRLGRVFALHPERNCRHLRRCDGLDDLTVEYDIVHWV